MDRLPPDSVCGAPPIEGLLAPFARFAHIEASSGLVLMACAAAALLLANSPWAADVDRFWHLPLTFAVGARALSMSLGHWINDGLMAVFFFLVGLEIKREVLVGELASMRRAALPVAAALGGMAVPAILYAALNAGGPGAAGWGVPMATDIAFALGVMALLGPRVPTGLKIFVTALAIADDLGAVLVIALAYSGTLSWPALAAAGGFVVLLAALNRLGVRCPQAYALAGLGLWAAVLASGLHATLAGVVAALFVPARTRLGGAEFVEAGRHHLDCFHDAHRPGESVLSNAGQLAALQDLEEACRKAETPLQRLEHELHPIAAYLIMPVFALANAGVGLGGDAGTAAHVGLGVLLGLVLGKPLGVCLASWLALRLNVAELPAGVSGRQIFGASLLAGIGFTMSLFIAALAFGGEPELLAQAKRGIIWASVLAGIAGYAVLRLAPARRAG